MKIGVASLGRLSEDTGGRNYIENFIRFLPAVNEAGHEFTLFVSEGEAAPLQANAERAGVRIIEIPNTKRTPLHKVIGEQLFLPAHIRKTGQDVMYFPGNFASTTCPVPYVLNIRAVAHYYGAKYGVNLPRRIMRKLLMPPSAKHAAAIITPSEDIKRDVVRFTRVSESKITVIHHGVDVSLFSPKHKQESIGMDILSKYTLSSEMYLLYVSALWRYKNQDKLIRAFARADLPKEMKLVLAGKGTGTSDAYIDELLAMTKKLGIADRVIFTGQLAQNDLKYLYAHASAFVFPSSYESFGNPLFEAWASNIPVAAANVHSFPEIVADAGLLFSPDNELDMIKALELIVHDQPLRRRLIELGASRAQEFTWEKCLRRTLSLIESVRQADR
ncbi:MAG TPA: glycosyltransferase family 1 protein [Candidatus Kapabacteria bacterium]|nr:glycosyltransferase family 1 protein [Candidatus Kapabacteria bacterium]